MNLRALLILAALVFSLAAPLRAQDAEPADQRLPVELQPTADEATAAYNNQKYDVAEAKLQAILKKQPKCFFALANLGATYFQQNKFAQAKVIFAKALVLRPKDGYCLANLGVIAYQQDDFKEAQNKLEAAIASRPEDDWSHYYLACTYERLGRAEDARIEFQKSDLLRAKREKSAAGSLQ